MAQYLVAIYHPEDYDPSVETEAMTDEIHALTREMVAAGVRTFVGGLSPASKAKSLRAQPNGKVHSHRRAVHGDQGAHRRFLVLEAADWTRLWRGGARLPSPAVRRSRCASFFDGGPDGSN